jgi:hypothetical protein
LEICSQTPSPHKMAASPQLTTEYLQSLNKNTDLTSSELVDQLSDLEAQASVLQLSPENIELLTSYYGSYLLALFLDGDLYVFHVLFLPIAAVRS